MKRNKVDYVVVVYAVFLLLIVLGIAYFAFTSIASPANNPPLPTPIPTVTEVPPAIPPPPLINYDTKAELRLVDKMRNRPQLSQIDASAKTTMLNTVLKGYNSGVAYESETVRIEYVKSLDLFMAEIKTTDIQQAKNDANVWFRGQGLSQEGICNLPVMFLLNLDTAEILKNKNILFSPLPNSC
jgi:hypothetical protein